MTFKDLKPGDIVAIVGSRSLERAVVSRVNSTFFCVEGGDPRKFSLKSGASQGSTIWIGSHAEPWSAEHEEMRAKILAEKKRLQMARRLSVFPWEKLGQVELEKAIQALEGAGVWSKNPDASVEDTAARPPA